MKSMRILLINDNHKPLGGAERYFFDLKERLKTVPEIEVFSLGFGPHEERGDDFLVLKGLQSKIGKWLWQIIFNPLVYFKIRHYLKEIQPDVIHLHNIKQYSLSLFAAIRAYPIVQTIHDYGAICPTAHNIHKSNLKPCPTGFKWRCFFQHQMKHHPIVYLFLIFTFLKTRRMQQKIIKIFFSSSPQLLDYLKRNRFTNTIYIPPFVKTRHFYSFDKVKPCHFLFAGQFGSHKGVPFLLKEFALAREKNRELTLTLAGTGPIEADLRIKAKQLKIEPHVFFVGWQDNLEAFYEECTAVIFPSIWMEAFGLVMAEAMMHAKPIIGTNRGSPSWLIDDKQTGLIIDPSQPGDLAEKILLLANEPNYAKELGIKGFKKIHSLIDNEAILKKIVACYMSL